MLIKAEKHKCLRCMFVQCAMTLHSELLLLAPAVRIRRSLTDATIIRRPVIQTACVHLL